MGKIEGEIFHDETVVWDPFFRAGTRVWLLFSRNEHTGRFRTADTGVILKAVGLGNYDICLDSPSRYVYVLEILEIFRKH
jgi:hypothetical protein